MQVDEGLDLLVGDICGRGKRKDSGIVDKHDRVEAHILQISEYSVGCIIAAQVECEAVGLHTIYFRYQSRGFAQWGIVD